MIGEHLRRWRRADSRPVFIIYGMLKTKVPAEFLVHLAPHVQDLRAVAIPDEPKSLSAEEAASAATGTGISAQPAASVAAALADLAARHGHSAARVLICGSLYLAGTVLRENG